MSRTRIASPFSHPTLPLQLIGAAFGGVNAMPLPDVGTNVAINVGTLVFCGFFLRRDLQVGSEEAEGGGPCNFEMGLEAAKGGGPCNFEIDFRLEQMGLLLMHRLAGRFGRGRGGLDFLGWCICNATPCNKAEMYLQCNSVQ
eukprot:363689-Chlamydomonas_euryale.AAC.2